MSKILINYADKKFYKSQVQNTRSGLEVAGFDNAVSYNRDAIDRDFLDKHSEIFNTERGAGLWAWKPYFIRRQFETRIPGTIVMYSDSGATFARNIKPLFDKIEKEPMGIAAFHLAGLHYECQYNRKKVIEAFGLNPHEISKTPQHMASFILFRICDEAKEIVDFWLDKCLTPELIMDQPKDPDEFINFVDHRHDQALWSLTVKKFGVPVYPDPTQWGLYHGESGVNDFYIQHHREKE
jgi:hypothetical protein